jgi:hypothetical protein
LISKRKKKERKQLITTYLSHEKKVNICPTKWTERAYKYKKKKETEREGKDLQKHDKKNDDDALYKHT